jgi:hypothetical protein
MSEPVSVLGWPVLQTLRLLELLRMAMDVKGGREGRALSKSF